MHSAWGRAEIVFMVVEDPAAGSRMVLKWWSRVAGQCDYLLPGVPRVQAVSCRYVV